MAFFGLFGNKQPTQPVSGGGIETGIPVGSPQTLQLSNPNTMGGLMPATPVIEKPASGDIEETGTWAAAKSALDAERVTAAASSAGIVPPGANEHLDMTTGMTPPLSTYGAPSPVAIEGSPSAPKFDGSATAPDAPTPPPFSMDAIAPKPELVQAVDVAVSAPESATEVSPTEPATDGETPPTNPDETVLPSSAITPKPPVLDTTPPLPTKEGTQENFPSGYPEKINEPQLPIQSPEVDIDNLPKPLENPGTEIPPNVTPLSGTAETSVQSSNETPAATEQPATVEPVQDAVEEHPEPASDNHVAPEQPVAEVSPAEPTPVAETPVEPSEEIPNNVVPFPAPVVTPAVDVPASEPTTEVAQTETTPEPAELPQVA